ncbi:MFS transporter [Propioniciclava flava]|uniref:Major facilitator superfamily (MFS) profile domain-containing protein n=1 Tax=Propioniciclava flava TaxID=2072026 RepID=A0A4Q2ELU2_9ACTN|nr:MFS transporter [Propioniciclava flava]RXW33554.1 hypothetical protein C1706_02035 [Propioniciclava flava]
MSSPSQPTGLTRTNAQHALVLLVLFLGEFIAIFDISVANVLLPTIQRELHVGGSTASLVIAAYSAAYASSVLLSGRLGDTYGFARIFQWGVGLFGLSSLLCAFAPTLPTLVVGRVLQGLGAALLFPQVLAGVQTAVPPHWRGAGAGIFGAVLGIGSTLGQIGGAWLGRIEFLGSGWRFAFFVNVPICAAILLVGVFALRNPDRRPRSLDVLGAIYSGVGIGALVVGLALINTGALLWSWLSLLVLAVVALVLFACRQRFLWRFQDKALISREVLRSTTFIRGLGLALAFYLTQVPFYVVLTQAAQSGTGLTPTQSANLYAVLGVAFLLTSIATARLSQRVTPVVASIASVVLLASFVFLMYIPIDQLRPGNVVVFMVLALNGLAGGCIAPSIVRLALTDVPKDHASSASGMVSMSQQLANSIGTTLTAVVFVAGNSAYGVARGFGFNLLLFTAASIVVLALTGSFACHRRSRRIATTNAGRQK